jgi:hypothetical protein
MRGVSSSFIAAPTASTNCTVSRIPATAFLTSIIHINHAYNPRPIPPYRFYATPSVLKHPALKPAELPAAKASRMKRNGNIFITSEYSDPDRPVCRHPLIFDASRAKPLIKRMCPLEDRELGDHCINEDCLNHLQFFPIIYSQFHGNKLSLQSVPAQFPDCH